MCKSYIPDFKRQMELGANHLLEKGIMVSYVGWKREKRTFLQTVTLEELQGQMPALVEAILGENTQEAEDFIANAYPDMKRSRVRKAVKDLRFKGVAEVSIPRISVDCPIVHSCEPDGEIIFPSYVTHGVPPNETNRIRKALGVNALTKGTLGDKETISEIIFGRYA
jgi:hypothetical protein